MDLKFLQKDLHLIIKHHKDSKKPTPRKIRFSYVSQQHDALNKFFKKQSINQIVFEWQFVIKTDYNYDILVFYYDDSYNTGTLNFIEIAKKYNNISILPKFYGRPIKFDNLNWYGIYVEKVYDENIVQARSIEDFLRHIYIFNNSLYYWNNKQRKYLKLSSKRNMEFLKTVFNASQATHFNVWRDRTIVIFNECLEVLDLYRRKNIATIDGVLSDQSFLKRDIFDPFSVVLFRSFERTAIKIYISILKEINVNIHT